MMSNICRPELIAPIVISSFNTAVTIISILIAIRRPPAASKAVDLQFVTVIWISRAIQFWVALAAILLYAAPAPTERAYVVVAAGIMGDLYNDWVRQLEIFQLILVAPSKNMIIVFRVCFGISALCVVLLVPDLVLVPGKWPRIAMILVCAFHRISIAVPILLHRRYALKRIDNFVWASGNILGAAIQFFGLLLGPFECRLFLYAASSVFGVLAQIPTVVHIETACSTLSLPRPEDNKSTTSIGRTTFRLQSRWSLDSEITRHQRLHMSQWVSDKINSDRFIKKS